MVRTRSVACIINHSNAASICAKQTCIKGGPSAPQEWRLIRDWVPHCIAISWSCELHVLRARMVWIGIVASTKALANGSTNFIVRHRYVEHTLNAWWRSAAGISTREIFFVEHRNLYLIQMTLHMSRIVSICSAVQWSVDWCKLTWRMLQLVLLNETSSSSMMYSICNHP